MDRDSRKIVERLKAEGFQLVATRGSHHKSRKTVIEDDTRVVRANVTFEAGMLRAIDEAAARRGLSRSSFLASCARREIEAAG